MAELINAAVGEGAFFLPVRCFYFDEYKDTLCNTVPEIPCDKAWIINF